MKLIMQSDDSQYVDVGYGRPIRLSSAYLKHRSSDFLLPSRNPGAASFHTAFEEHPFVIIDLETSRRIKRIRIFNEEASPARASPIAIQGSQDGALWFDIATINYVFGGRRTHCPLDYTFRERLTCRYIKVAALSKTFLHLDYIEVLARLPEQELGRLSNIRFADDLIMADYAHHDSHGFTWTFTVSLTLIINAAEAGVQVDRVDYSRCMVQFKDDLRSDPYTLLFQPSASRDPLRGLPHAAFERHGVYARFKLAIMQMYAHHYFWPSEAVLSFEGLIVQKYGLQLDNALVLVYRGTDKRLEVKPTPVSDYIRAAKRILEIEPGLQVIVQTDQQQALDEALEAIPNSIHFNEMPVTGGDTVIHSLSVEDEFGLTKSQLAIRLLAMVHLLSQMKYIITHTGNIGLWIAIYRGSSDGLYQFDTDQNLRGPDGEIVKDSDTRAGV